MKASAQSLCNNILSRAHKEKIGVTPMKLQKLLYYVCVKYVQETGVYPLLERFETWEYGPVIPSVYSTFKPFGAAPIKGYAKNVKGQTMLVDENLNPVLRGCLDFIWGKFKDFDGIALANRTHRKDSGWYSAFQRYDDLITLEDIALYIWVE